VIVTRRDAVRSLSSAAVGLAVPDCFTGGDCSGGTPVDGFTSLCFSSGTMNRQLYVIGDGPPVLLLHELPGLSRETLHTAKQLAGAHYTVVVPLLFGRPGDDQPFKNLGRVCRDDEFACNRGERTSPHVAWLRDLASCARTRWPKGKGVGVVGMCLTGIFPIAMLRSPDVVAPVVCQPTLPFNRHNIFQAFGWFMNQSALALTPDDLEHARTKRTDPILGIRYRGDRKCQKEKFERLAGEFGDRFFRIDFPGRHHSTLVGDFCPDALLEVLAFFNRYLRDAPDSGSDPFPRLSANGRDEVTPKGCRGHANHHTTASSFIQKDTPCSPV
jgi:dienelactone hydrolase